MLFPSLNGMTFSRQKDQEGRGGMKVQWPLGGGEDEKKRSDCGQLLTITKKIKTVVRGGLDFLICYPNRMKMHIKQYAVKIY